MQLDHLVERFEFYASKNIHIAHDPKSRYRAFMHLDIEDLQAALTDGCKFPALFLQTPEVEKQGEMDNVSEVLEFTYIVLVKAQSSKILTIQSAKRISDTIYNRLLSDTVNDLLPGSISSSTEGMFGPTSDQVYGWAVSISITDGYSAEVNANDWSDRP